MERHRGLPGLDNPRFVQCGSNKSSLNVVVNGHRFTISTLNSEILVDDENTKTFLNKMVCKRRQIKTTSVCFVFSLFAFIVLVLRIRVGNICNKAISMMRGKSPRTDVEMSKKLNFVAAILDFWRPFLNQF